MNTSINRTQRLRVGVVFGGASSEYEVSLMSAASVLKNIDVEKYSIYKIGITKDGRMFYYKGEISSIQNNTWQQEDCIPCVISPDRSHHGIILLTSPMEIIRLDTVFPILHGKNGEDGTIQGLFTLAGIPFVGCDTLSSACCMDKTVTKTLLDHAGIKNSKWISFSKHDYQKDSQKYINIAALKLGFPCFVKPVNAGSSVGISKAVCPDSLKKAVDLALEHDSKVLVEKMIKGIELECAVLGNYDPIASVLGEIEPCNDFYDYDAKYLANKSKTYAPARISEQAAEKIRSIAVEAYRLLGCRGLARVDFFLTEDNQIILNELNTLPGFTSISMYPKLIEKSGISYPRLIDRLIELSVENC